MTILKFFRISLILAGIFSGKSLQAQASDSNLPEEVKNTLKKATLFYHNKVASHGGYVYYYSLDLQQQWGEGKTNPDMIFVQPPGTPTVGTAYINAFNATQDSFYLKATREAALALVYGQLESGGWTQVIHFVKPGEERMGKYRNGKGGNWNNSSLDDGQTQAALEMLIRADSALEYKDMVIHESVLYGLNALLKAQFPNGAFPQVFRQAVKPKPVLKARFPGYDWKTEGIIKNYWDYYTLNDYIAGNVADVLITAHRIYKEDKYRISLEKLGDFLLLARMPDPQPGWCQQYNYDMIPVWARKFEPPAISSWESMDAMETLIKIAHYTGNKKYLEPVPASLEYFQKCMLPDGLVTRYYEFGTNKPLYMNAKYELSYNDRDAPAHYGWKQNPRFDDIRKIYREVLNGTYSSKKRTFTELEKEVSRIIKELDEHGRWISTYNGERLVGQPKFKAGFQYISSELFSQNIGILSEYIFSLRK